MQSKRLLAIMIAVGLTIAIGGCQTGNQSMDNAYSQDPELPAAALPEYAVYLASIPVGLYLPFVYSRDLGLSLTEVGIILMLAALYATWW